MEAWKSGTMAVARMSLCTGICTARNVGSERPSTGTLVHEVTACPSTEAAALSGWPSNSDDSCTRSAADSGEPASAFAAATPATAADADDPSPRDCGMALVQVTFSPGAVTSAAFSPERTARTTKLDSSRGSSSAPSPVMSTRTLAPIVSAPTVPGTPPCGSVTSTSTTS